MKHGLKGVRLESIQVGGTLCTSKQALERFFVRLAEADSPDASSEPISRRQQQVAKVGRQVEAALK
jgi:hypothetical protein